MNEIALVTANFGGIDSVKELPLHPGINAFHYTDASTAATVTTKAASTWTNILVPDYPRHDFGPRIRSKYFKLQIHRLDEVRNYRWLAWADSALQFSDLGFLSEWMQRLEDCLPEQRLLLIPHPERATVREEAEFVLGAMKGGFEYMQHRYANEKIAEHLAWFSSQGWPVQSKLWCSTVWLVENSRAMAWAWDDWWGQVLRFGAPDQLSLPFMIAKHHLRPQSLDIDLWNNKLFKHCGHLKLM